MSGLAMDAVVLLPQDSERVDYPTDAIWLRAAGHGDLQVADYTSTDRDGPPFHSHPWDEAQIVVDGFVEFRVGEQDWVGPPYDGLARDLARLFATGTDLDGIVEVAGRHGLRLG